MPLTDQQQVRLAGRARTLHERLDRPAAGERVPDPDGYLDEWRDRVADGDPDRFAARLDRLGLSNEECRRRLASNGWPADEPLPDWVDLVADLVAFLDGVEPEAVGSDPTVARHDDGVPFVHLLAPVVAFAADRVDWSTAGDLLAPAGRDDLADWLLDRLRARCAHALFVEFRTFVARRDGPPPGAGGPESPPGSRHYDAFVAAHLDDALVPFLLEYAFLARLLATTIRQWVAAIEEFGRRLAADRAALGETFGPADCFETVVGVEALGDRHGDGRAVLGVTFASGRKLAYKPRDLGVDAAFARFCAWLDERGVRPTVRAPACLPRDGYGWMAWIDAEPSDSAADAERYYRRAGATVAVLYALGFSDGHLENVVAAGDQPVVVDLETLVQAPAPEAVRPRSTPGRGVVEESVLRTGLLPAHRPGVRLRNTGGFGSDAMAFTGVELPEFEAVNTDAMELSYWDTGTVAGENLPVVDGEVVEPTAHADAIADGFEATYRALVDHRADLLAEGGPLAAFEGVDVRFIHRPTRAYGVILAALSTPRHLRTGLTFGCTVEELAGRPLDRTDDPAAWAIYEAERAALRRLDVPRFAVGTGDTTLRWDGRDLADPFGEPAARRLRRGVESLAEADLAEQLDYLALAYGDLGAVHAAHAEGVRPDPATAAGDGADVDFERAAHRVFERIADGTTWADDGAPTWYLREHVPGEGVHVHPPGPGLSDGRLGIGLFAAALAVTNGDARHREFATALVAPVLADLDGDDPLADLHVGGGGGVGSLVYGLTRLWTLLDDDRYLDAARRAAALATADRIAADDTYDVLGGAAGAALGLLALHDETGDPDALDRAVACGDHLLANRVAVDGAPVWSTVIDGTPLTGFSHGVAGIAYALSRLADATGTDRFREAALESLAFERERFDPDRANWPDRRPDGPRRFVDAWCHGRTGIGLARLGTYERDPRDDLRREVEAALSGIDPAALTARDHLCCGNLGRVAFLLRAGRSLDEPGHREAARRLAAAGVARAEERGRFATRWGTDHWIDPTLFGGEAGIGYELLRLDHPTLPCVLLWE